jgi:simple sugar transport system ATP-binding protein
VDIKREHDEYIVEMKGITKRFPGVLALDKVDFNIKRGEIVALLGENGAGKTTLMNILYGLYVPDEGEIYVDGVEVSIRSPADAIRLGINMVHQQFMLIENFTVLENIVLGSKLLGVKLDYRRAIEECNKISKALGFSIPLQKRVRELSAGERQRVEIVKALIRKPRVLILDEPTSVLTPQEVKELFKLLRDLKSRGISVVFISHKLNEVLEIADRIVVLRRGKKVGELSRELADPLLLAKMMVGKETLITLNKPTASVEDVVLLVKDLIVHGDDQRVAVNNVSLRVRRGEIVGIAGVAGNGQKELAEAIYGLRPVASGKIFLDGVDVTKMPIKDRLKLGISYVPQDRIRYGVVRAFTLIDNVLIDRVDEEHFNKKLLFLNLIDIKKVTKHAEELIKKYEIVAPHAYAKAGTLSGGNIQRLILARELERAPKLMIAEEPTAGLDIKATEYIRQKLLDMKASGVGILLISSDLSEIFQLSDIIAVMYNGEIVGVFRPEEISYEDIGLYMTGLYKMPREEVLKRWESY